MALFYHRFQVAGMMSTMRSASPPRKESLSTVASKSTLAPVSGARVKESAVLKKSNARAKAPVRAHISKTSMIIRAAEFTHRRNRGARHKKHGFQIAYPERRKTRNLSEELGRYFG